ncbi:hypothetical protein HK100_011086 [Physocladia obscura]|uniref:HMG box domain-containing protein n=1 Tax=Physocladia obscura TaxID=109957 RepID=A0AAD5T4N3_9FUNG|nr:hypothetical protein HK100_011086 [Physocladia obscura]
MFTIGALLGFPKKCEQKQRQQQQLVDAEAELEAEAEAESEAEVEAELELELEAQTQVAEFDREFELETDQESKKYTETGITPTQPKRRGRPRKQQQPITLVLPRTATNNDLSVVQARAYIVAAQSGITHPIAQVAHLQTRPNSQRSIIPNSLSSHQKKLRQNFLRNQRRAAKRKENRAEGLAKPPNPFILYRRKIHADQKYANNPISFGNFSKIVACMWKELPEDEKDEYRRWAKTLRDEHGQINKLRELAENLWH